ncbi:3-ketodihydrosphingosine reductase isoform X2 [Ictalurus furcatus]|uniref:3-ketodihydrosphingosine reductase isoform X2 n=1 Tax=Ictalurus furcatus TaxID=66913 RepID=UPI00235103D4|nr:3-ketodihydrosphingosine reductase isoform X2 [Ictalurus furcatus]
MPSEEAFWNSVTLDWFFSHSGWSFLPFMMMMILVFAAFMVAFVLFLYMISPLISPKPLKLNGAHVVVTGGSSGIGKCIAMECYKQGAFITLVARDEGKLVQAKKAVEKCAVNDKQVVLCISVDVSKDYSQVESVLKQAQEKLGPVDMLVNCAGTAVSGKFEELGVQHFQSLMEVNYLGSVYATRAVISNMKERRMGRVVFVCSQAGQLGLFGYTAYSASKFALRGLAEALQMEVKPYNIYVTVSYPPDTDTPALAEENKMKPLETKLISETSGVYQPEQVAKVIVKDAMQGNFSSSVGPDGYMLSALTCGMSPVTSITEGLQQVHACHSLTPVSLIHLYVYRMTSVINSCVLGSDCDHGAVPHHRTLLPEQLRQHRTPLHDPEGAEQSVRQDGVTPALPAVPPSLLDLDTHTRYILIHPIA